MFDKILGYREYERSLLLNRHVNYSKFRTASILRLRPLQRGNTPSFEELAEASGLSIDAVVSQVTNLETLGSLATTEN